MQRQHCILLTHFSFLIFFSLFTFGCNNGGGSNKFGAGVPQHYDRDGHLYMPTITDQALTYAIVRSPENGPGELEDFEYTYQHDLLEIDDRTLDVMVAQENGRMTDMPAFEGTQFIGLVHPRPMDYLARSMDYIDNCIEPIRILPASLPDIGTQWDLEANFSPENSFRKFTFRLSGKIVGVESVTVPAGTYDCALTVEYSGQITEVAGMETDIEIPITGRIWFVEGLGPVKGISESPVLGEHEIALIDISDEFLDLP